MADEKNHTFGVEPGSVAAAFAEAEKLALDDFVAEPAEPEAAEAEAGEDNAEPVEGDAEDTVESEIVEEDQADTVVEEAPKFDPAQWDGKLETLPEDLRAVVDPIHKTMERGMHKKFQELADLRKEYESKLESLRSDPAPSPRADVPPPPPTADMTYEDQVAAQDKRDAWFAAREVERQLKTLPQFQKVEEMAKQAEGAKRVQLVQGQPGFTPEIGAAMAQIAESHPYYATLLDTNEGSLVLFQTAKLAVENNALRANTEKAQQAVATKAGADIKKKASAAQSAISRSGGTRKTTPADNFAKMGFAEAERAALEAWEAGRAG